jgi:transposase
MTAADSPLPKDAEALAAMLIAERAAHAAETERLLQIIKALQRHRFGRRAETLPVDQLELALEEVQQAEAEGEAKGEADAPEKKAERARTRRTNRGSLPGHLPRIETIVDIEDKTCPCCRSDWSDTHLWTAGS